MPVLYFYRLPTSIATAAFREAIWGVIHNISENPQIVRRPLIVLDIDADPSPGYQHPGHGYVELPTEKMVDLFLARLKAEPIVFQSKTVEFTREKSNDLEAISVQQPCDEAIRSGSSSAPPWRSGRYTNQTTVNKPQPGSRHHRAGTNANQWRQPGRGTQEICHGNPARSKGREHRPPALEHRHRASLERLEFGVLRGKNFSVEYSRSLAEEGGWMTFEDNNSIHVTIGNLHKDLSGPRLAIFNSSIAHIGLGTEEGSSYMLLMLSHNPDFQKGNNWNQFTGNSDRNRGGIWVKHSCLDKSHESVAPYTSRWIRLVFDRKSDRQAIPNIETCQLANIPVTPTLDPPLTFNGLDLYSRSNIEAALGWLRSGLLDWHVAFQCEALFRNGILTPHEFLSLRQMIEELAEECPQRACDALKTFGAEIEDLRARCTFGDIENGNIVEDFNKHVHNNQALTPPGRLQRSLRKTDFLCHRVNVTPTAVHLAGPLVEPSNRVIRKYPGFESYFILVSLTDEKGYRTHRFARERLEKFLKHGIQLGDRHYELLAYSQSGLQEHSCFFSAPFTYNGQTISAQLIRDGIGNFGDLIYCPARYGARMSQAFSSTDPSVVLDESTIRYIHDFHDRTGIRTFTDGCATISKELAKEVWERMLEHGPGTRRHDLGPTPCAFQVKMGGSEGVVRIDPSLQGRVLSLRPSMTKFDAPGEFSLEIARALLIMLLWSNGVEDSVFAALMRQNLETTIEGMKTCAGVADQFMWNRLGAAFHLDHTFRKLARLGIELDQPGVRTSGLGKILNGVLHYLEQSLKYDARIGVPDSYTLVGVCDEHKYLKFNEVYVCVQHLDRRTGKTEFRYLRGHVLVARSPVVHPGDAQVLFAIGKPPPDSPFAGEGNNLPNCVVFSCLGERSVPSMLGGGNLGGDMYDVISYQQLIPQHIYAPAEYASTRPKRINTPSTIEDLADFIVDVRVVTIDHLEIASRSELGFRDEKCLANAKIHSKAVDFVQSGYWVNRNETYRRNREESSSNANGRRQGPDWQAHQNSDGNDDNYYECPSVLGRLFRSVELSLGDPTLHSDTIEQDPVGIRECIFRHVVLHMEVIQESMDKFDNAISALRLRYTTELNRICTSLSKRISEVQVMIGANFEANSNSHLIERVKRSTSALADFVRLELKGGEDELPHEWLARAWKAYLLTSQLGDQVFGALSFSWLALELVLDALQALDENFLPDEESQDTPCVEVEYPTATGSPQPDNNHPPIQIDTNDRYSNRGSNYRGRGSGFGNSHRPRGRPRM